MSIKLKAISGYAPAITSLKMTKRHYDDVNYEKLIDDVHIVTDAHGFFKNEKDFREEAEIFLDNESEIRSYINAKMSISENILSDLNKLAKWGAGVGLDAWIDDGHETILRYIDLSFVGENLGYGTVADLDSHVARMNNRMIRSSSRIAKYDQDERSEWYVGRICSIEDMLETFGKSAPNSFVNSEGKVFIKTPNGYVVEGEETDGDARRGNYPLCIPMQCIFNVNLYDLRHIYMRRNKYTHATPELKNAIEDLADQVEQAIPCDLGKLVRYDYALIPDENGNINTDHYELVHIMDIKKVYVPRTTE